MTENLQVGVGSENLQVGSIDATLEEEANINGEMYVIVLILSQMIMIYHLRF